MKKKEEGEEEEEEMPPQPVVRQQSVPPQPMEGSRGMDAPQDGRDSRGKPAPEQAVPEVLQPVERTHAGEVCEGLSPVGGTPRWSRGRARSSAPEEEGAAETTRDALTPTPIPRPAALLGARR